MTESSQSRTFASGGAPVNRKPLPPKIPQPEAVIENCSRLFCGKIMDKTLKAKQARLESILGEMKSLIVAFSGGVDSAFLLAAAQRILGNRVLAATAVSNSLPARELEAARELAQWIGAEHLTVETEEMQSAEYLGNPTNRCYHCKSHLYSKLKELADERGIEQIANGTNLDDLGDYRPGLVAAREGNIASPLVDAGLDKNDIRALAREMGLPAWDKPALACLSSRIPYGQAVTAEKLERIEKSEDFLLSLGFREVRVRHHEDLARIELGREDLAEFLQSGCMEKTSSRLKEFGFKFVTLDLEGFRSGSLNEVLSKPNEEPSRLCGKSN